MPYTRTAISLEVCVPFEKCLQNNKYITLLNLLALDGVPIHNLEEVDYHLVHGFDDSDSENDFIYHERMPQILLYEVWDLPGKDVDTDFPQDQGQLPSVDGNNTSRVNESFKHLRWLLIFLCLWSSFSSSSDNALEIPWVQSVQLLQVLLCCSQSQSIYFASNWDWTDIY